ncbi:MAG TPA: Hsp20/alpha crystallin family protein [Chthonomonadaceae bacterium]|nr:Hsp20/alpha crystallin family protein [Chthonomonadaceae bacterium]
MNARDQGGALSRRPQGALARPRGQGALAGFDPWREMEDLRRRMDTLMGAFFGRSLPDLWNWNLPATFAQSGIEPDVDIYENDTEYTIQAALPGVDPKDIHVEATDNSILLTAERRSPFEQGAPGQEGQQPPTQHRQSRSSSYSRYQFAYTLPADIKPDAVRANFRNGMLELHLPKQNPTTHKTVPVSVQTEAQPAEIQAGAPSTTTTAPSAGSTSPTHSTVSRPGEHEGNPAYKMGPSYTPSAGEDHTTQAQAAGARTEHTGESRQQATATSSVVGGHTNPMQPPTEASSSGTTGKTS